MKKEMAGLKSWSTSTPGRSFSQTEGVVKGDSRESKVVRGRLMGPVTKIGRKLSSNLQKSEKILSLGPSWILVYYNQ